MSLPSCWLGKLAAGGGACGAHEGGGAWQAAARRGQGGGGACGRSFAEEGDPAVVAAAVQRLEAGGAGALDGGADVGGGLYWLPRQRGEVPHALDPVL